MLYIGKDAFLYMLCKYATYSMHRAYHSLPFLPWLGGGQVSIIWKCFPCDFQRANELFTGKCLQSADHKGAAEQQLVCRTTRMDKLIAINPLPRNKEKMRKMNIRYAFKHSQANCQMPHGRCSFPHSHIEEEAWNVLLYGGTPQQKVGRVMYVINHNCN